MRRRFNTTFALWLRPILAEATSCQTTWEGVGSKWTQPHHRRVASSFQQAASLLLLHWQAQCHPQPIQVALPFLGCETPIWEQFGSSELLYRLSAEGHLGLRVSLSARTLAAAQISARVRICA